MATKMGDMEEVADAMKGGGKGRRVAQIRGWRLWLDGEMTRESKRYSILMGRQVPIEYVIFKRRSKNEGWQNKSEIN